MKTKLIKPVLIMLMLPCMGVAQTFIEKDGIVAVEAEHYFRQSKCEIRCWEKIGKGDGNMSATAGDDQYLTASGKAYIEVLPDTRVTHDDKLIAGENFSNEPGEVAVVSYNVEFSNPGKYYVWVRAFSTGAEDNGIHVGLDGEWPESGRRMQWCEGKNEWTWASRQRTDSVHCGEERLIYLEVPSTGKHVISFSMREDGFEFDKFILSKKYEAPVGTGIAEVIKKP